MEILVSVDCNIVSFCHILYNFIAEIELTHEKYEFKQK